MRMRPVLAGDEAGGARREEPGGRPARPGAPGEGLLHAGRDRASAAAVWGLWALICLLLGLAAPLAFWLTAALLHWPAPRGVGLSWLAVSGLAFALVAPWIRVEPRAGDPE